MIQIAWIELNYDLSFVRVEILTPKRKKKKED